jgi:hypothetical protein
MNGSVISPLNRDDRLRHCHTMPFLLTNQSAFRSLRQRWGGTLNFVKNHPKPMRSSLISPARIAGKCLQ